MSKVIFLLDGQCVHVGPQRDRQPMADAECTDDPGSGKTAIYREAEASQTLGYEGGRIVLLECRLGVRMQMPSPGRHLRVQACELVDSRHRQRLPPASATPVKLVITPLDSHSMEDCRSTPAPNPNGKAGSTKKSGHPRTYAAEMGVML